MKRKDIRVRDPYIVLDGDTYYMYATSGDTTLSYYYSDDLENWEPGGTCFEIPHDFWAYKDVWAAEVHKYNGKFYLLVSLKGKNGLRGTQIAVASSPKGPFVPISDKAATPENQSCIDGTLFVDAGVPYIIYSHDWPDNYVKSIDAYVGEICYARLSDDLTCIVGEPRRIFASNEVPISRETPHHMADGSTRFGSDAPFVQKLSNGSLYLTWSPYLQNNYVVLGAVSKSGRLDGKWEYVVPELFDGNGGHAMFFENKDGKLCMVLHAPEKNTEERAHIYEMCEKDGGLAIVKEL